MGFDALVSAYKTRTGDGYANAVFRYLADAVRQVDARGKRNEDWTVTTTREEIAEGTELSISTVRRALLYLEAKRFIESQALRDGHYLIRLCRRVPIEHGPVPIEHSRVPIEHDPRSIGTPYKEPGKEPRIQESIPELQGDQHGTHQRDGSSDPGAAPGSTSTRRTSRGDPVYIPRQ